VLVNCHSAIHAATTSGVRFTREHGLDTAADGTGLAGGWRWWCCLHPTPAAAAEATESEARAELVPAKPHRIGGALPMQRRGAGNFTGLDRKAGMVGALTCAAASTYLATPPR
jgi:hypothetical protein